MAKRITEKQKEEIVKLFISGENTENLSKKFNCTKLTIVRILKKNVGDKLYKELSSTRKLKKNPIEEISLNNNFLLKNEKIKRELFNPSEFVEIAPLDFDIDSLPQKDLTSVHISDVTLPKSVFMIVDKKVELEIKYLKEYPKWQFLSPNELKRKTIEIHFDLKVAKNFCSNEQKVIKVPNTEVFKIAAPILLSRGITRIVCSDQLIAL